MQDVWTKITTALRPPSRAKLSRVSPKSCRPNRVSHLRPNSRRLLQSPPRLRPRLRLRLRPRLHQR
jgi:hypothetical protein